MQFWIALLLLNWRRISISKEEADLDASLDTKTCHGNLESQSLFYRHQCQGPHLQKIDLVNFRWEVGHTLFGASFYLCLSCFLLPIVHLPKSSINIL